MSPCSPSAAPHRLLRPPCPPRLAGCCCVGRDFAITAESPPVVCRGHWSLPLGGPQWQWRQWRQQHEWRLQRSVSLTGRGSHSGERRGGTIRFRRWRYPVRRSPDSRESVREALPPSCERRSRPRSFPPPPKLPVRFGLWDRVPVGLPARRRISAGGSARPTATRVRAAKSQRHRGMALSE